MESELKCPYCGNNVSRSDFNKIQKKMKEEIEKKLTDEKKSLEKERTALRKEKEGIQEVVEKRTKKLLESEIKKATSKNENEIKDLNKELNEYTDKELKWEEERRGIDKERRKMRITINKESEKKAKEMLQDEIKTTKEEFKVELEEKDKIIRNFKDKYENPLIGDN